MEEDLKTRLQKKAISIVKNKQMEKVGLFFYILIVMIFGVFAMLEVPFTSKAYYIFLVLAIVLLFSISFLEIRGPIGNQGKIEARVKLLKDKIRKNLPEKIEKTEKRLTIMRQNLKEL